MATETSTEAWVKKALADAPPLTADQRMKLAELMRNVSNTRNSDTVSEAS